MPDLTPNYGFRIPKQDGSDLIMPDDIRVPITSIDAKFKTTSDSANASLNTLSGRVDKFDTATYTSQVTGTSALTIASGWTLTYCSITLRGKLALFSAQIVKITSAIAGTADGNVGNITIGTIPTATYRPMLETGISSRATGPIWGGYVNQAGTFAIAALVPNYTLPINGTLTCSCMYMVP